MDSLANQPDGDVGAPDRPRRLAGGFFLAYLVAFLLIAALVHYGGVWNVLANTRLLDALISGGVVALTDQDTGFVLGVPSLDYYVASQDPVSWGLVLLVVLMFAAMYGLKAYQFHLLARFAGYKGNPAPHARAYLYGRGVNRLLPFDAGSLATARELEPGAATAERGMQAVFLAKLFTAFEVALFAAIGLYLSDVTSWIGELFWPLVILGIAYYLVRPGRAAWTGKGRGALRAAVGTSIRALAQEPRLLATLCLLSAAAFLLADEAAYVLAQAFSSENVILNIEGGVILMAVVGGQLARLVQFTPGGIGQYEWGFATVLYVGGVGFPEAATVALLVGFFRYLAGALVFGALMLTQGVESNLRSVLDAFRSPAMRRAG